MLSLIAVSNICRDELLEIRDPSAMALCVGAYLLVRLRGTIRYVMNHDLMI